VGSNPIARSIASNRFGASFVGAATGVADNVMLHDGNRTHPRGKPPVLQWLVLCAMATAAVCADVPASWGQGLPSGGGPLPPLRRGANGQIETVPPSAPALSQTGRRGAAPAPKAAPAGSIAHPVAPQPRVKAPPGPARPVITVAPITPHARDTTPRGAVVATYSVMMSDGSPFTGTVRFGAPYHDGGGVFALSGNKIIVNPNGPGLGPNRTTITKHITLEAIP
jgi:hypothetical protein